MKRVYSICFYLTMSIQLVSATSTSDIFIKYITSWGGNEDAEINLNRPEGIAISPAGMLYIADTGNHRVLQVSNNGQFIRAVGGQGWETDQFDLPVAIDASNGLDIFIADYNNRRILRHDKDLNYIETLKKQDTWSEPYDLGFPLDVALSSVNQLYCIDSENNRVIMLDINGNPLQILGDFNAGEGHLLMPVELIIRPDRSLWVLDSETGKVAIFDEYGNFSHDWNMQSTIQPVCIVDCGPWGIVVFENDKNQMFVFNKAGKLLHQFDIMKHPDMTLLKPVDAAYFKSKLYVVDQESNEIHVFSFDRMRKN